MVSGKICCCYPAVCFLCFPAAVYLMIKGRKARNTESIPFLPFCVSGGDWGSLFLMNKRRETVLKDERKKAKIHRNRMEGKPYSRGFLCYGCGAVFAGSPYRKAGQIHDETAAAMVLHEGVEKMPP